MKRVACVCGILLCVMLSLWTPLRPVAAEQPYKGITINVITGSANDPNAPITGPFYYWKDEWEQRTGAKLNLRCGKVIPASEFA